MTTSRHEVYILQIQGGSYDNQAGVKFYEVVCAEHNINASSRYDDDFDL
jgi:tubulin beta